MNENSSENYALKLIVFRINEEQPFYGINVFKTFEIQRAKHFKISEVPRANEYIEGIVYIRNQPVPLVNLPRWLRTDLSEQEQRNSSIIFCNFNNIRSRQARLSAISSTGYSLRRHSSIFAMAWGSHQFLCERNPSLEGLKVPYLFPVQASPMFNNIVLGLLVK